MSTTTIKFQCETITPLFMHGADGKTPELRPASIKGVMRFWWRAINGDLPLNDYKENAKLKGLRSQEAEIFGNTEMKSSFSIKIKNYKGIPERFEIEFLLSNRCDFDIENFFKIVVLLGGFGKSAKKIDKGKVKLLRIQRDDNAWIEYTEPNNLNDILELLGDKFEIQDNKIISKNFTFNYPMVYKIWIENDILNVKLKEDKIFQRKLNG